MERSPASAKYTGHSRPSDFVSLSLGMRRVAHRHRQMERGTRLFRLHDPPSQRSSPALSQTELADQEPPSNPDSSAQRRTHTHQSGLQRQGQSSLGQVTQYVQPTGTLGITQGGLPTQNHRGTHSTIKTKVEEDHKY